MRIARDGTWFHEGKPIRRPAMVQLFSSILMRGPAEGKEGEKGESLEYFLVTPVEKVRIQVEDCPMVVNQMEVLESHENQQILFTTNTDETLTSDKDHRIEVTSSGSSNEPHPIVHVRSGLNALINRAVFYRLVEAGEERKIDGRNVLGVWSAGEFFSLGSAD
ncbi:MAG: DUF1285 domain-containing protein [Pseudomonadales bacterium]|nr:DUF1285 domain-containing protein [Pseudomonadales bacterium]